MFNFFRYVVGAAHEDKMLPILNTVYLDDTYAWATNRYVAARTEHGLGAAELPEPALIPLDVAKAVAKIRSEVVSVVDGSIVLGNGQTFAFEHNKDVSYPPIGKFFDEFEPSNNGRMMFNSDFLALFSKWYTKKERFDNGVLVEFGEHHARFSTAHAETIIMPMKDRK